MNNIICDPELKKLIYRKLPTNRELKRVEIFIMKWILPEVEARCLSQIILKTGYPYKLTVLDTRLLSINEKDQPCAINTSKVWNDFIKKSTCDYILIMDSDAYVEDGWLTNMMNVFKQYPDAGVVAPISENGGVTPEQEIHRGEKEVFKAPSHVSGYCLLIKKEIFKDIGYFDEDFYYFGQDSDWCERIQENDKWNIYICPNAVVNHGDDRKWSMSSNKVNEFHESVWRWETDRIYAQSLAPEKKRQRGFNPNHYPWGGIGHTNYLKQLNKKNE